MLIVLVDIHVTVEGLERFIEATRHNAAASLQEPGVARFDLIQQRDEPTRFALVEVYRDEVAPELHKQTAHYQTWRDTVAPLMASPRSSRKFRNLVPGDIGWNTTEG